MKKILCSFFILLSIEAHSQTPKFSAAVIVGSDFSKVMTTIGLDLGVMSYSRKHSLMVTIHGESIANNFLSAYGRQVEIKEGIEVGRESVSVGLKYAPRLFACQSVEFRGVVHPWYSPALSIKSAYFGGRVDVSHKGDMIGVELVRDPFGGRYMLRFVFTTFNKK